MIPPIKIKKKSKLDTDLLKLFKNNVRTPFEFQGDMEAQIATNNIGTVRLQELVKKYGEKTFKTYLRAEGFGVDSVTIDKSTIKHSGNKISFTANVKGPDAPGKHKFTVIFDNDGDIKEIKFPKEIEEIIY